MKKLLTTTLAAIAVVTLNAPVASANASCGTINGYEVCARDNGTEVDFLTIQGPQGIDFAQLMIASWGYTKWEKHTSYSN